MLPHETQQLYPFTSRFFPLDGLKYHYVDEGQGEPILLVHGNPTWSFYYRNLIQALKDRHRMIAPDHIGMGLSSKPGKDDYGFRLIDRVDNLSRFMDHLAINEPITLVVHDWGGMIGLTWARKNLSRIKRLILLNTSGFHLPDKKKLPLSLKICRNTHLGTGMVLGLNSFTHAANRWCSVKGLSLDVKKGYLAPHPTWHERLAVLKFVQDIPLSSADPSFAIVTETQASLRKMQHIPTLVLWGAKDFVFDDDFYSEWREYLPKAEFHYIRDAGHYVLEDNFEFCLEKITAFLAKDLELA